MFRGAGVSGWPMPILSARDGEEVRRKRLPTLSGRHLPEFKPDGLQEAERGEAAGLAALPCRHLPPRWALHSVRWLSRHAALSRRIRPPGWALHSVRWLSRHAALPCRYLPPGWALCASSRSSPHALSRRRGAPRRPLLLPNRHTLEQAAEPLCAPRRRPALPGRSDPAGQSLRLSADVLLDPRTLPTLRALSGWRDADGKSLRLSGGHDLERRAMRDARAVGTSGGCPPRPGGASCGRATGTYRGFYSRRRWSSTARRGRWGRRGG